MKAITLLITFTIINLCVCSQTDNIPAKTYHLKGKLNHELVLPPYCGTIAFASVIELEVLECSEPNYFSETIVVIVPCPRSFGEEFFVSGNTYSIVAVEEDNNYKDYQISNEDLLSKNHTPYRLWVSSMIKFTK